MMSAWKTSLALATSPCDCASLAANSVPNIQSARGSPVQDSFGRLQSRRSISTSLIGPLQGKNGSWGTLSSKRSRKRLPLLRIQGVAATDEPAKETTQAEDSVHKVVIVGAGVAGLSAALALHRIGIKTHVLEQSSHLRIGGSCLSLWSNAWRALEYLGVADGIRERYRPGLELKYYDRSGKFLKTLDLEGCPGGPHELRGTERKVLMDTLAGQLPPGTIQLNSKVLEIRREAGERLTKLDLQDGSVVSTEILVGCDGVNSVVAKWLGLPSTRYVGQIGIRGMAEYPKGHDLAENLIFHLGTGKRFGFFPLSDTKVYWFLIFNRPSPGPRVSDPNLVKAEALELLKDGWPAQLTDLVTETPIESISRTTILDRWNIPGVTPPLFREGVVLTGDAMHPMTPNLAQGSGTGIEDAIELAQTLGHALSQDGDAESIRKELEKFVAQRQERTLPISVKAYILGALYGAEFPPMVYIRDKFLMPMMMTPAAFISHTLYDTGKLPAYSGSKVSEDLVQPMASSMSHN